MFSHSQAAPQLVYRSVVAVDLGLSGILPSLEGLEGYGLCFEGFFVGGIGLLEPPVSLRDTFFMASRGAGKSPGEEARRLRCEIVPVWAR